MTTFSGNDKIQDFLEEMFSSRGTVIKTATERCMDQAEDIYSDLPEKENFIEETTNILAEHLLSGKPADNTVQLEQETIHKPVHLSHTVLFARMITFSYITTAFWMLYKTDSKLQQKYFLTVTEAIEINRLITASTRKIMSESIFFKDTPGTSSVTDSENTLLVIPLTDGTALCPVTSGFNSGEAGGMLKEILQISKEKRIGHLILEFSGMEKVNDKSAAGILKVIRTLKVLGVNVSLTGIQPELAQSVVLQNLPFKGLSVFPDIKSALLNTPLNNSAHS
jgi:anti-anti-sigma regulatory factor